MRTVSDWLLSAGIRNKMDTDLLLGILQDYTLRILTDDDAAVDAHDIFQSVQQTMAISKAAAQEVWSVFHEDTVLNRLLIGHSYLTHSFIL